MTSVYGLGRLDLPETKPTGAGDMMWCKPRLGGYESRIFVEPVALGGLQFTQVQHKGAGRVDHLKEGTAIFQPAVGSTDNRISWESLI